MSPLCILLSDEQDLIGVYSDAGVMDRYLLFNLDKPLVGIKRFGI